MIDGSDDMLDETFSVATIVKKKYETWKDYPHCAFVYSFSSSGNVTLFCGNPEDILVWRQFEW